MRGHASSCVTRDRVSSIAAADRASCVIGVERGARFVRRGAGF
jgi:hypothetical protein